MAFRAGTTTFIALDGVNGAGTNVSRFADSFDWPQSVETQEVSAFGTAAKAFINGLTDGDTVSISGPYDAPIFTLLTGVKAAQSAGSSTTTILWGPGGSVSGEARITAEAWVTSVSLSSSVGGRVEMSASLQVTGAVTNNTW
jgi:catalase (peroxidase I)